MAHSSFIVQRDDMRATRIIDDEAAVAPLPAGGVRARIDLFAFTSTT